MIKPMLIAALALATAATAASPAVAAPGDAAYAKSLLMQGVGFDTVKGRGRVPAYAAFLKAQLVAGGFAAVDIAVEPVGETALLHLIWRGTGTKRPIAITGHMDVVEANPKDWVRDPFVAVEDAGFIFGRGVSDDKFDVSMITATLIALKSQGFKPGRDVHFFLSGDEESGDTAIVQAKQAKAAGVEYMLNGDSGGGSINAAGKADGYGLSAAEKTYADFRVRATNPGGHSSRPTATNAIAELAAATVKIQAYHFVPQSNEITRASLVVSGRADGGSLGQAALAFAANPDDAAAAAALRADPGTVGQIGTTCVPTMVSGGHAENALPQAAVLNVNCRIFPGVAAETVRAELARVVGDPGITVTTVGDPPSTPASPLRPDVVAAVAKAVAASHPGIVPTPGMDAGASDSVHYRSVGIPSYGVSGLFMKSSDVFIHGLNERIPTAAIAPALVHWRILITELAK